MIWWPVSRRSAQTATPGAAAVLPVCMLQEAAASGAAPERPATPPLREPSLHKPVVNASPTWDALLPGDAASSSVSSPQLQPHLQSLTLEEHRRRTAANAAVTSGFHVRPPSPTGSSHTARALAPAGFTAAVEPRIPLAVVIAEELFNAPQPQAPPKELGWEDEPPPVEATATWNLVRRSFAEGYWTPSDDEGITPSSTPLQQRVKVAFPWCSVRGRGSRRPAASLRFHADSSRTARAAAQSSPPPSRSAAPPASQPLARTQAPLQPSRGDQLAPKPRAASPSGPSHPAVRQLQPSRGDWDAPGSSAAPPPADVQLPPTNTGDSPHDASKRSHQRSGGKHGASTAGQGSTGSQGQHGINAASSGTPKGVRGDWLAAEEAPQVAPAVDQPKKKRSSKRRGARTLHPSEGVVRLDPAAGPAMSLHALGQSR